MQKVWDYAANIVDLTQSKLWAPYLQVNKTLLYVDEFLNTYINSTLWLPGKPNNRSCVIHTRDGYNDQLCTAEHTTICYIKENLTYLQLRGLCNNTSLDQQYFPSVYQNELIWIGAFGTIIKYNGINFKWEARIQGSDRWATSEARYTSLLLGAHNWIVYSDRNCASQKSYTARLSLTACSIDQYNCDDGGCVPLDSFCDSNAQNEVTNCEDGSDEINCTILHDLSGYKKQILPISYPYTEIFIFLEILDIQDIFIFDGKIKIMFNLSLEWQEPRIPFQALWPNKTHNILSQEEITKLWTPDIIFSNVYLTEYEELKKISMLVDCNFYPSSQRSNLSALHNSDIFRGKTCHVFWNTKIR
jgi:hypothetical protein